MHDRNQDVIALTHVCQAWRKIFASCPSAWTDLDCENADKTRVYLERSKSLPVDLRLERVEGLSPYDPFFQVISHAIPRLRSLAIHGTPANLQDIVSQLSRPAPLLRSLTIEVDCGCSPQRGPAITTTLFNGDLSSLRELRLKCVTTALPWRNMANLTSFTLGYTLVGDFPIKHLLDFLKSAPRLRKVRLHNAIPTSGAQNGRLVSLGCLKRMDIIGGGPSSLLLDHLLIPVGAKLTTQVGSLGPLADGSLVDGHLPRSLDNLRNFSDSTIQLHLEEFRPRIRFSGPNGQVTMVPAPPRTNTTHHVLKSLFRFDPSKIERLTIVGGNLEDNHDGCTILGAFIAMKGLRTLIISRCKNLSASIRGVLDDNIACPKLEELVLDPRVHGEKFDIQVVVEIAAVRASRGRELKSVRIVSGNKTVQSCALKLEQYVSHVECDLGVAAVCDNDDGSDYSDDED